MQGMTPQIIIVLGIMLVASVMLVTELVRSDVVALLTLSALGLSGLVGPQDVFAGFSRPAVITIMSVFIITAGLERSGATRCCACATCCGACAGGRTARSAGGRATSCGFNA